MEGTRNRKTLQGAQTSEMASLSVIVPAFNEELRLAPTLRSILDFAAGRADPTEVIVVDDGSRDGTSQLAKDIGGRKVEVIRTPVNRGKGHAVRIGMLAASGRHRLFTDADGSTPIDEYAGLRDALDAIGGNGVAFGSIGVAEANVERSQRGIGPALGKLGNLVITSLALPGVRDSQRGFKLFSEDAAEAVFSRCVIDGWGFDVEALALARRFDLPTVEVPVTWRHIDGGTITAMAYLTTLQDVIRIRWRIMRGAYDRAPLVRNP